MTREATFFSRGRALPVAGVVLTLLAGWYLAALLGNWNGAADALARAGAAPRTTEAA